MTAAIISNRVPNIWDEARGEFVFSKERHGMSKHDYHLLEFVLDDQTGDGLRFPKVPHDAMWVVEGHEEPGQRTCRTCAATAIMT